MMASRFDNQLFIFYRISRSSGHHASHVAFKFNPIGLHGAWKVGLSGFFISNIRLELRARMVDRRAKFVWVPNVKNLVCSWRRSTAQNVVLELCFDKMCSLCTQMKVDFELGCREVDFLTKLGFPILTVLKERWLWLSVNSSGIVVQGCLTACFVDWDLCFPKMCSLCTQLEVDFELRCQKVENWRIWWPEW